MTADLLEGLNEQQRAAVTAGRGPVLVLAGPGSGKTRVLTRRIAYLLAEMDVRPWQIMAVTFTNRAAGEMRDRVRSIVGGDTSGLQIGTFHATCARILRIESSYTDYTDDYVIYDTDDQISAVTQAMGELDVDPKKFSPRRVLYAISAAKNEIILPEQYNASDYFGEVVARVYPRYQSILLDSNAMDFDDLLLQMVLVMRRHEDLRRKYQSRYEFVLVDEFQDTNTVQYELVRLFGEPQNNVFVVGDEDQSIYAFRGADFRNVQRFREHYRDAQVVLLEQNYRSTQVVLDVARAVIDRNRNRTPKALFTSRQGGDQVVVYEAYDEEYEARYIADEIETLRGTGYHYDDFAVMYRTNAQSRALEEAFVRYGIPHRIVGGVGFYQRREIRDLLAYLRLIHNPDDRISFTRIINVPRRGIGKRSLADFQHWAAQENLTYSQALAHLMNEDPSPLSNRAAALFARFGETLRRWQGLSDDLVELFDRLVSDIGFNLYLHDISDNANQVQERAENVNELRGLLARADDEGMTLAEFLTEQALMTDQDLTDDPGTDRVTLLTLHAAKGLEFPVVFIAGLEEGLLPHIRSLESPEDIEEERRLFYVGITRARDRLYLTHAFRRTVYGSGSARDKSAFLLDIPPDLSQVMGASGSRDSHTSRAEAYRWQTRWDSGRSALSRLSRDLQAYEREDQSSGQRGGGEMRKKIIPFPGSSQDAEAGRTPEHASMRSPMKHRTGQRVKHPLFGEGTVIEASRSGDDEEVTVAFKDRTHGIKTVLASLANLTVLD